jgi:YidC/Oxa1 family membrane protein insertase
VFDLLFEGLARLLAFFYELHPSYGLAIALLTLAVMLATSPLTLKQTRSMLAMQRLAPELKRLQKEHKGDREAMTQAQMALYKEHGVNPLAGCLPLILQAPVFIVLFQVIKGLTHKVGEHIEPKYVPKTTDLFHALREGGGKMLSLGIDLAQPPSGNHGGFASALPYYLLVAVAVATSYFQLHRMTARNPAAAQANPQMAMMNKIMPVFSGMFALSVPAGVGIYIVVSNLFRIAQQEIIYKWDPHVVRHHGALKEARASEAVKPKAQETKKDKVIDAPSRPARGKPQQPAPPGARNGSNGTNGRVTPPGTSHSGRSRNQRRKKRGR